MVESIKSESPSTVANILTFFFLFGRNLFIILCIGLAIIFLIDGNLSRLRRPGGLFTFKLQTTIFETLPIYVDVQLPGRLQFLFPEPFNLLTYLASIHINASPPTNEPIPASVENYCVDKAMFLALKSLNDPPKASTTDPSSRSMLTDNIRVESNVDQFVKNYCTYQAPKNSISKTNSPFFADFDTQ
ncbi:hypothetical protein ONZ45_g14342 [Pleurotus djamor]|nr:hypothetical protein ONZ45_g14342 [Pleurotus djamor]